MALRRAWISYGSSGGSIVCYQRLDSCIPVGPRDKMDDGHIHVFFPEYIFLHIVYLPNSSPLACFVLITMYKNYLFWMLLFVLNVVIFLLFLLFIYMWDSCGVCLVKKRSDNLVVHRKICRVKCAPCACANPPLKCMRHPCLCHVH